jgi:hypothetical protein
MTWKGTLMGSLIILADDIKLGGEASALCQSWDPKGSHESRVIYEGLVEGLLLGLAPLSEKNH